MTAPTMNLQAIAERYERAQCVKYGRPSDWDVEGEGSWWGVLKHRPPRYLTQLMAVSLCADCPLLAQCAADCLAERPRGVIRAGVAVTRGSGAAEWQKGIWRAVAAGGDLTRAYEALSRDWSPSEAREWIDKHRPWSRGDLARLPRRARLEGARPLPAGVRG